MDADEKQIKKTIEAALFMSPKAVSIDDLAKIAKTSVAEARVALNELVHDYEERDSALVIKDVALGIKMAVDDQFQKSVSHFAASPEFNKGVMKTLAYISYKQPVNQTDVIKFRNNKGYEHIKILEENGFITRQPLGRSYKIFTTKKFLQYFGNQQKNPD